MIEYSETFNRYTSKDAFPFPNMQDLLDQAAGNIIFENRFEVCVYSNPTKWAKTSHSQRLK